MALPEFFSYETKCRRCGTLADYFTMNWAGTLQERQALWLSFVRDVIRPLLLVPSLRPCRKCQKPTIQEIVSYADWPTE